MLTQYLDELNRLFQGMEISNATGTALPPMTGHARPLR